MYPSLQPESHLDQCEIITKFSANKSPGSARLGMDWLGNGGGETGRLQMCVCEAPLLYHYQQTLLLFPAG